MLKNNLLEKVSFKRWMLLLWAVLLTSPFLQGGVSIIFIILFFIQILIADKVFGLTGKLSKGPNTKRHWVAFVLTHPALLISVMYNLLNTGLEEKNGFLLSLGLLTPLVAYIIFIRYDFELNKEGDIVIKNIYSDVLNRLEDYLESS